jgi:sugar phosphate isomerase/epimerase
MDIVNNHSFFFLKKPNDGIFFMGLDLKVTAELSGVRVKRFRVPGWGDVKWKKVMSALLSVGYNYVLSFEHEDPVMSREDGCEKAIEFLKPLIIKAPLLKVWW